MEATTRFTSGWIFFAIVVVLVGWFSALPLPANAQGGQGQNAVYPASGTCCVGSFAFIDASMFTGSTTNNICAVLNFVLQNVDKAPNYPSGAVIDARGLPGAMSTSMTCTTTNPSPWAGITNPPPSVILLPAGTIVIPSTWVLPNNTTLIGEGDDLYLGTPQSPPTFATTLQACKQTVNQCSFTGSDMIDLGSSPICGGGCNSISVEHLALDGLGQSLNGIVNTNAQTGSHVDHVRLYQILGTGLLLEGSASDSGPYSNIIFDSGSFAAVGPCVNINGQSGTRGFHNLTCISETNDAAAAILLDSSNNSLEDVRIAGFYDGIRVGANADAKSNVLVNIIGDTNPTGVGGNTPIIVVHITSSSHAVSDISIMGANNAGGSSGTITIQDELTGPTKLTDTSVAIYALGEQASGGYSRYTTSPNAATWVSGTSAPNPNAPCPGGSLYSNSSGSGGTLWVCPASGSSWGNPII